MDWGKKNRAPLLLIAGTNDHTVPMQVVQAEKRRSITGLWLWILRSSRGGRMVLLIRTGGRRSRALQFSGWKRRLGECESRM